jgi:sulfur carrier protein
MDPSPESATPHATVAQLAIQVNGEPRTCPAGLNLEQALAALGFQPRLVVVELNGTILPRQHWPQQPVLESDSLEVVTIVGGGS